MLNFLVRDGLTPALAPRGITVKSQGGNTLTVARNIRNGSLKADLFGAAEANANQLLTGDANGNKVRWFATFARNAIVVFYSPNSRFRAEFEKAARGEQPWYAPLTQPGVKIARSNPDEDPGGYLTLLVNQLGEKFSGEAGLKQRILGDDRNPAQVITNQVETATKFATGEIDAIFGYESFAISAGDLFLRLPPPDQPQRPRTRGVLCLGVVHQQSGRDLPWWRDQTQHGPGRRRPQRPRRARGAGLPLLPRRQGPPGRQELPPRPAAVRRRPERRPARAATEHRGRVHPDHAGRDTTISGRREHHADTHRDGHPDSGGPRAVHRRDHRPR